jgi:hypothetical protein
MPCCGRGEARTAPTVCALKPEARSLKPEAYPPNLVISGLPPPPMTVLAI